MTSPNVVGGRFTTKAKLFIAGVAVLLFLAVLFSVRPLVADSAPDVPSGLSVSAENGKVKVVWNSVSGADEYILTRDGSTVIYQGSKTTAEDLTAATGGHKYQVRALSSGAMSSPSEEGKVTVTSGWGDIAVQVAQFPKLLPQTPEATGWNGMACRTMVKAVNDELGAGDTGSDKPMVAARLNCFKGTTVLQPMWMTSKESADSVMSRITKTATPEAISWRYGTGYWVPEEASAYLRLTDHPDVLLAIITPKGTKDQSIQLMNSMPIDE